MTTTCNVIVLVAAMLTLLLSLAAAKRLRQTTLVAPARWLTVASVATILAQMAIAGELIAEHAYAGIRYFADLAWLCPPLAVWGAKRPQDTGWQFVVLTFWVAAAIPALQHWAFSAGTDFDLHGAWRLLIAIIILASAVNYIATRHAFATMLASIGMLSVFWPWLMSVHDELAFHACGVSLIGVATLVSYAWRSSGRDRTRSWDRPWLDFRDAYGIVWGLRVLERLGQSARGFGWSFQFTWQGIRWQPDQQSKSMRLDATSEQQLRQTYHSLLRRFATVDWIDKRLPPATQSERGDRVTAILR